jgi:hypothetical protein
MKFEPIHICCVVVAIVLLFFMLNRVSLYTGGEKTMMCKCTSAEPAATEKPEEDEMIGN